MYKVYTFGQILGLIQFLYIGNLHLILQNHDSSLWTLTMAFWFIYHTLIEIAKFRGHKITYFRSAFTWLNVAKLTLQLTYLVIHLTYQKDKYNLRFYVLDNLQYSEKNEVRGVIDGLLMTVSWLLIVSVLRLWGAFRIFTDVFFKTIKESVPFLLALGLMLIATTDFYYYKYQETRSHEFTHDYLLSFILQYRIIVFSDFEYLVDEYDFIDQTFFLIFSVVIFVFLMNLLIADISYQHAIIMGEVKRTDYAHICRLVLELETMKS